MREGSGPLPAKFDWYSDVSLRVTQETFLGLILFIELIGALCGTPTTIYSTILKFRECSESVTGRKLSWNLSALGMLIYYGLRCTFCDEPGIDILNNNVCINFVNNLCINFVWFY